MSAMMLLVLALAVGQTTAALHFSWDTVPVFFHSANASGEYTQESIEAIARYPMVTISKWQSYYDKTIDDEVAMVEFMKAVKAVNPKVATYFYMNAWRDLPQMTYMRRQFREHPEWALLDEDGNRVIDSTRNSRVFDQSQYEVQEWWRNICLNATILANGDGCYCDSSNSKSQYPLPGVSPERVEVWEQGILNLTRDVQALLGSDKLLIGKASDQLHVKAVQLERFVANNKFIDQLMEGVKNGKVMQAHVPVGVSCTGDLTNYLSAFLIAAGEYSYFGCGDWYTLGNDTSALYWHPDYDKPLGAPLAPATYEDRVWRRQFASGTVAEFDTSTNEGVIIWGNNTTTEGPTMETNTTTEGPTMGTNTTTEGPTMGTNTTTEGPTMGTNTTTEGPTMGTNTTTEGPTSETDSNPEGSASRINLASYSSFLVTTASLFLIYMMFM